MSGMPVSIYFSFQVWVSVHHNYEVCVLSYVCMYVCTHSKNVIGLADRVSFWKKIPVFQ